MHYLLLNIAHDDPEETGRELHIFKADYMDPTTTAVGRKCKTPECTVENKAAGCLEAATAVCTKKYQKTDSNFT